MDNQKKQELAEFDERWKFEQTINVPTDERIVEAVEWQKVRKMFNQLQDNNGDLYMTIANLELPSKIDKAKLWYRNRKQEGEQVTFHHTQVYNFYLKLAHELDVSVGQAVHKIMFEQDQLREYFDLGKTVNVSINNVDAMGTAESSNVSKDELEEFIEDE